VVASFIGGGNRSIWRKAPTCLKSLTNFIFLLPLKRLDLQVVEGAVVVVIVWLLDLQFPVESVSITTKV
jgi:hypothetical protein